MTDQLQSALKLIHDSTVEEIAPLYEALGRKTFEHRKVFNGFLPLSVFPHALAIGGVYPAVELIVEVANAVHESEPQRNIGYLLGMRKRGDHGFADHWHFPGTVIRIGDIFHSIWDRLFDDLRFRVSEPLSFMGVVIHHTQERLATAVSLFWRLRISEDEYYQSFKKINHWRLFKCEDNWVNVVPYQAKLLRSLRDLETPFFITLPGFTFADAE